MHMDKAFSDITIDLHQINTAYVALASMMFDRFISGLFIAFIVVYCHLYRRTGNDSNLLIVFYVQIMPDDLVMQLHRF